MAQWGNTDDAANSVLWAVSQLNQPANSTNQTALFGNSTANAYFAGVTVGQYGVDVNEQTAARAEGVGDRAAHAGWVLRTTGQGGRAGRTQTEVLVAMSTITTASDAEDTVYEDAFITITTQPTAQSANATADETATFTVVAAVQPTGTALTYAWTYANGDAIAETSNATASSLTVDANTAVDATEYKVTVGATGADSVVSSNVAIEVTT